MCNHPELFERNEGSSFLHFAQIPNTLFPPPFGELEDVHYSGDLNPISYKVILNCIPFVMLKSLPTFFTFLLLVSILSPG